MSKKNADITPWSFYKNDAAEMPTQLSNNEIKNEQKQFASQFQRYQMPNKKKQENKMSFKNFQEINKKKVLSTSQEKKLERNSPKKKQVIGYSPIINTSLQMIDIRDQINLLHQQKIILQTLKTILKEERSEQQARKNKQKYSGMFPSLFKNDLPINYSSKHQFIKKQYPSNQLFNNLISKHAKII